MILPASIPLSTIPPILSRRYAGFGASDRCYRRSDGRYIVLFRSPLSSERWYRAEWQPSEDRWTYSAPTEYRRAYLAAQATAGARR